MEILFSLDWWRITPWFQQIAAILTIFAIPYVFLKLVIYKAKHKIYFLPKETYHEVTLRNHSEQPQSFWLQLMVKNKGFEISRGVEAYLTEIWKEEFKKNSKIKEFRAPVKLKWSHEADIYPINIMPRESRRLDICYICQNEKILHIMAKGFPSGTIRNELDPGSYVFVIKVTSQNNPMPAKFIFKVNWDGEWRTLKGDNYVKNFKIIKMPVRSFRNY